MIFPEGFVIYLALLVLMLAFAVRIEDFLGLSHCVADLPGICCN